MAKALRSSKIHGAPVYPVDFTHRVQLPKHGHIFIRYGARPDGAMMPQIRQLPDNYLSHGGKVSLSQREPPSQTEHYDLGLQGKL